MSQKLFYNAIFYNAMSLDKKKPNYLILTIANYIIPPIKIISFAFYIIDFLAVEIHRFVVSKNPPKNDISLSPVKIH